MYLGRHKPWRLHVSSRIFGPWFDRLDWHSLTTATALLSSFMPEHCRTWTCWKEWTQLPSTSDQSPRIKSCCAPSEPNTVYAHLDRSSCRYCRDCCQRMIQVYSLDYHLEKGCRQPYICAQPAVFYDYTIYYLRSYRLVVYTMVAASNDQNGTIVNKQG